MISADTYNFPTGAELLAVPAKVSSQHCTSALDKKPEGAYPGKTSLHRGFSGQSSTLSLDSPSWNHITCRPLGLQSTAVEYTRESTLPNDSRSSISIGVGSCSQIGTSSFETNIRKEGNSSLRGGSPFERTSNREDTMATYLPGSNVQNDAMHTLYLMNPSYAGYADASNTGNMVLIGPSTGVGQSNPLPNSGPQQQQHYVGFPLPPALAQNSLAQHSPMTAMSSSSIGHQNSSSTLYGSRIYNNNWNGGNEFSFVPSNDTQSLAARLTSVNSGQQSTSELSQYNLRRESVSSLHEQQTPLLHSGVALGLNMENTQASTGPGQGLSLSLSPQQPSVIQMQPFHMQSTESGIGTCPTLPHVSTDGHSNRGERFPNKWAGSLSSFRASSRDGILGAGYHARQPHLESNPTMSAGSGGLLNNSKYLKAAQQLLDEVVSFGRCIKGSSTKHTKLQSWMGHGSFVDGSFAKDRSLSDTPGKDGAATASTLPPADSVPEQNNENVSELTPAERQELQMKKAKLMAMLDEVDRRYRQYYNQMQIVVTSFESAAGIGSAKTYTALALQTISRHFRSLRDAISGQIRVTSSSLGEEDPLAQGRGEASRLRFVDQQLRQQRALQQLGMMQQHAWRPQRGLPERSVSVLRAWLFEHFLHPYPKDSDKMMLARQTGLTRSQVSNWFINARVRLWKPMVEEMYLEETREAEIEATGATEKKVRDEVENMSKGASMTDGAGSGESLKPKKPDGGKEGAQQQHNPLDHASEMLQARHDSMNMIGSSDRHQFHEKDGMMHEIKKARNGIHDTASMISPNMSMEMDMKSEETPSEGVCQAEKKLGNDGRYSRENYNFSHNGIVHPDTLTGFGSYHNIGGLSTRYAQEGLAARYPGNSGVSLTLGLQHCDGLSLSGQQHYIHGHGLQATGRRQDGSEAPAEDYYSISDNSAGQSNSYETINFQNRKRFATQLLHHDFVA